MLYNNLYHHLPSTLEADLSPLEEPQSKIHKGDTFGRRVQVNEETPQGITIVNVGSLWAIPPKQNVKICVIDSGYDLGHPDLPTSVTGWNRNITCGTSLAINAATEWSVDRSVDSHGTHVAGTIGAIGFNGGEFNQILFNSLTSSPSFHCIIHLLHCIKLQCLRLHS